MRRLSLSSGSLIRTILEKVHRLLVIGLLFWLPKQRRKPIDRWLRGHEEYRKLQQADAVIISFGKSGRTWLRVMISRFYSFKVVPENSHTMQAGRIRISHLGSFGSRSNRASTAFMASLEREIPFS